MPGLAKWDVLRVLPPGVGHTKFAVCVDADRLWFFYINSDPPPGRKRRPLAIALSAFQATFLSKESFLDTTEVVVLDQVVVQAALNDPAQCLGPLSPMVRGWAVACVRGHNALEPAQRDAVLNGEV